MGRFIQSSIIVAVAAVATGCGAYGTVEEGSSSGGGNETATSLEELRVVETDYAGQDFPMEKTADQGCTAPETVEGGEIENRGQQHVDNDVKYKDNPPTSGDHDPVPLDWGVYDEPQPTEQFVHNLEHGHVVVTYKGLSDEQYDTLIDHRRDAPWHLVVTERPENPKDGVYYLAWDARLYCAEPSADALQWMIDNYRDQAPEVFMTDSPKDPDEIDSLLDTE